MKRILVWINCIALLLSVCVIPTHADSVSAENEVNAFNMPSTVESYSTYAFIDGEETNVGIYVIQYIDGEYYLAIEEVSAICRNIDTSDPDDHVQAYQIMGEISDLAITSINSWYSLEYPQANRQSPPTGKYNCHSYAWYSQNVYTNDYWIDDPLEFYADGRYCCSTTPQEGDIICYFDQLGSVADPYTDTNCHSGIVTAVYSDTANNLADNVEVESKWGSAGLYIHDGDNCPYTYADYVRYFRSEHAFTYTNAGSTGHIGVCDECGYETEVISHSDTTSYESIGAGGHRLECSLCGYTSSTQSHNYSTTLVSLGAGGHGYRCSRCGYAAESMAHDSDSLSIINYDDQGHAYKCDECNILIHSIEPHHYVLPYVNCGIVSGHAMTCYDCGHVGTAEPHVWKTMSDGKYKCLTCGLTSNFIPIDPQDIPEKLLAKLNALFASGDGAIAFDVDTVLCRVDGEYYLVKGTTVENAVAFVTQELLTE